MQVNVLVFPLVLGIVPLVLVVLVCWTECFQGGGTHERRAAGAIFLPATRAAVSAGPPTARSLFPNFWRATGTVRTSTGITGKPWLPVLSKLVMTSGSCRAARSARCRCACGYLPSRVADSSGHQDWDRCP